MKFVAIEAPQLERLRAVAKRLYTEDRLNGNEMRDLARTIQVVMSNAIDLPECGVLVLAPKKCDHPGCGGTVEAVVCDRCRSY